MSGMLHKVKEAVTGHHDSTSDTTHSNTTNNANYAENPKSSNHGPHGSAIANKLDPRVDSDRDNRAGHHTTTTTGPGGTTTTHSSTHGPQQAPVGAAGGVDAPFGTTGHAGSHSTNAGPHSSNVANKVDPRVDSDRDNRARHEALGGAHGPHSSNLANKADPRVDSDRDNRAAGIGATGAIGTPGAYSSGASHGYGTGTGTGAGVGTGVGTGTGLGHGHGTTTSTAGPHSSNLANKADPRVDSDLDNRARHQGLASSSYNTSGGSTTAGPHSSNIANKLDPRVDSDLDNRHNVGNVGTQRHI
ncbi:period circadian protein [Aspergillus flavus]|nr:period circadian protein [Aspergillus flavus]